MNETVRKLDSEFQKTQFEGEQWEQVKEFLPLAIAEFSVDGTFLDCNLAMLGLTGLSGDEVKDFFLDRNSTLKPEPSILELMKRKKVGERKTFKCTIVSGADAHKLLMGVVFPKVDASGTIRGQILCLIDVSVERDLRSQLSYNHSLLKNLLNTTDDIVIEINRTQKNSVLRTAVPLEWNWTKDQIDNAFKSLRTRLHPADASRFDQEIIAHTNKRQRGSDKNFRLLLTGNDYRSYKLSLSENRTEEGDITLIILKQKQQEAISAPAHQPELPISRFINHEIKNLLMLIQLESCRGLREMKEGDASPDKVTKSLKNIHCANDRVISLLQALEDLQKPGEAIEKESIALRELFEEMIHFCGKYLRVSDVRIILDCPDSIYIKAHSGLLQIVLVNLFRNAIDALKKTEGRVIRLKAFENGQQAIIHFEDNGPGIDDEVADTIFMEGISTKGDGRGLGLYLCQVIMKKMQGSLTLKSRRPACFEISIPKV